MIDVFELRTHLDPDACDDDTLEMLRSYVVGLWERETSRLYSARTGHVQIYQPMSCDEHRFELELQPVHQVTSVREKKCCGDDWCDVTDFELCGNSLERCGCPWGWKVEITYDGGYSCPVIAGGVETPGEIKKALLIQACFCLERMSDQKIAHSAITGSDGSSTTLIRADLHPTFKLAAERYWRATV